VVLEGQERLVGHGVDRERRRQRLDVEDVGGIGILGPGAREQQSLGPRTLVGEALPALGVEKLAIGTMGLGGDCDAESVPKLIRSLVGHRDVPAADEDRRDRRDGGVEARLEPALHAAHVRLGRAEVLVRCEQQRDVDGCPGEDRLLDRLPAGFGARDLDEGVVRGAGMKVRDLGDRRLGVVGEQRRDLERDPAVDAVRAVVDGLEQPRGIPQVRQGQLEEGLLVEHPALAELDDVLVVRIAATDRLVEDGRVGRQPGDRQLVYVALQGSVAEHVPGDVVEPQALAELV
jgi:hypothetical protein